MAKKLKIVYCGELDRTPYAPDHLGIRQGLDYFNGLVVDPILNNTKDTVDKILAFKPDLVIHGNTDSLGMGLGSKLHGKCKQVFWMLDYQPEENLYPWGNWSHDFGYYDAIFISNRDQMKMWSEKFKCPAYYLTHGCVITEMKKNPEFYHKAVFIGTLNNGGWYSKRYELLQKINYDWINGEGVEGRNQIWKNMPAIYHTSDCVIDVSHTWEADGYASGRFFYSAGLGGCSITKRFPGCEELYPPDCKAYFDTPEEANTLIEFYHNHPNKREAMKKRAWEWNRDHHHYRDKFKEIISKL